ncbi:hypothetical protein D3C85_876880 [compost metagenome]
MRSEPCNFRIKSTIRLHPIPRVFATASGHFFFSLLFCLCNKHRTISFANRRHIGKFQLWYRFYCNRFIHQLKAAFARISYQPNIWRTISSTSKSIVFDFYFAIIRIRYGFINTAFVRIISVNFNFCNLASKSS